MRRREGFERTAMPEAREISPQEKVAVGRTSTRSTPVEVQGHHVTIEQHHRDYVREKLGHKLGKFAPSIERINVRFEDLNGSKGGEDHVCRIQVALSGMGSVVVEGIATDAITAFDIAEPRIMHVVEHRLGRMRQTHVPAQRRAHQRERAQLPGLSTRER
jgi:ribosome-associated translation inhibitor RaiA